MKVNIIVLHAGDTGKTSPMAAGRAFAWLYLGQDIKQKENISQVLEKNHNLWEIKYKDHDCPIAEEVTKRIINLPKHLRIKPKDVQRIASKFSGNLLNGIVR